MYQIFRRLFNCGSLDLQFLENKIAEWELDEDKLIDRLEDCGFKLDLDINFLIHEAFYQAGSRFLNKVEKKLKRNLSDEEKNRYLTIDCNYMGSSFDSPLDNYDLMEPSEVDRFIENEHLIGRRGRRGRRG